MDNHEKENALNIVTDERTYQVFAESPEDARWVGREVSNKALFKMEENLTVGLSVRAAAGLTFSVRCGFVLQSNCWTCPTNRPTRRTLWSVTSATPYYLLFRWLQAGLISAITLPSCRELWMWG